VTWFDPSWLDLELLGNPIEAWAGAAAMFAAVTLALAAARTLACRRLEALAKRQSWLADRFDGVLVGLVRAIRLSSIAVVALYVATRLLLLPARLGELVRVVLTILLALQVLRWGYVMIDVWLRRRFARAEAPGQGVGYGAVRFVARLVLWTIVLLLALDNVGIEVTALIAGLGVGGVAIALAVQNILGDIFNSLSIVLDKPFEVGDFIVVGDLAGTVENIGVKTTRVRSLGGEQLVFSNSDLVGSRVRNFKRMRERRVVFGFGVTYDTPADKVERIPAIVRGMIETLSDTRFDRAHFKAFGESSLDFEVVYYVLSPDFNVYMDRQEQLNLALMRELATEGIEFAFPTRTLLVRRDEERTRDEALARGRQGEDDGVAGGRGSSEGPRGLRDHGDLQRERDGSSHDEAETQGADPREKTGSRFDRRR
jgi:small-conductance mechanosensitive channel